MKNIIALHGDFGSADMLKRDMGNPEWVSYYFDAGGWRDPIEAYQNLKSYVVDSGPSVVVGFSRGGSITAKLSTEIPEFITAAVLYEAPVVDSDKCGGSFPVLQIWNDNGALHSRQREKALNSISLWSEGRDTSNLTGRGRHIKFCPFGHSWDVDLNPKILNWILACRSK